MSYSYAYLGSAQLDASALEAWLELQMSAIDSTPLRMLSWGLESSTVFETVGDTLRDVTRWHDTFADIGTMTTIRALAAKDGDAWLTYRGDLAVAFLGLHVVGGRGRLDVVGFDDGGPDAGYRIAAGTELEVLELDEAAVREVRTSEAYRALG